MPREIGPVDDFVREYGLETGTYFDKYRPGSGEVRFSVSLLTLGELKDMIERVQSMGLALYFEGSITVYEPTG